MRLLKSLKKKGRSLIAELVLVLSAAVACGGQVGNDPTNTISHSSNVVANLKAPQGERYVAEVPDTLDLADRAALAINALARKPMICMANACGPKTFAALPLLRVMTGSARDLNIEKQYLESFILSNIKDGLWYVGGGANGAWACVLPQGLLLRAMSYHYELDHNAAWLDLMKGLADGLKRIAIDKGDHAYYPTGDVFGGPDKKEWREPFSYFLKGGWQNTNEPKGLELDPPYHQDPDYCDGGPNDGHWYDGRFGVPMYNWGPIVGLVRHYSVTGDNTSLEMAGKLVRFITQAKFWNMIGEPDCVQGARHAHYRGQIHAHVAALRGILEYAIVTNDAALKRFARDGYEFSRNFNIPETGNFNDWTVPWGIGETCSIADMIGLAIRLTEAGVGDYWEDVDRITRNQFVEQQQTTGPDRAIGSFVINGRPARIQVDDVAGCCTMNGAQALYYAWKGIMSGNENHVDINLLLNRASPLMDMDSYLPYEGKVVLRNKAAKTATVRIPTWVDRKAATLQINNDTAPVVWSGHRMLLRSLNPSDRVVIRFPMVITMEKVIEQISPDGHGRTVQKTELTYEFKGNTAIDVSPRPAPQEGYVAIYQRDKYRQNKAPMVRKERFVAKKLITW